jgi:hypothetical protein
MPTPKPYLTTTPWCMFNANERKRPAALRHCPSAKCRRAKACVDAHDQTYCQRSHESIAERRAKLGLGPRKPVVYENWTLDQATAKREQSDLMLAEAQAKHRDLTKRWKAGEFDGLYGKFKPEGVWKQPPPKDFA